MKKTISINLGGVVFYVDEDAYQLLKNYLDNLKTYFQYQQGGLEIAQDIENRISELLVERVNLPQQAVERGDIESIIAQIGQPEEIAGVESEPAAAEDSSPFSQASQPSKKLFRSADDCIISGVAGGLAVFWNIDVSILRLILLLLLFFTSGIVGWVYLALTLFVPKASTAIQKLQMVGEPINMENIGRIINEENLAKTSSQPQKSFFEKCIYTVGIILKACLIGLGIVFTPVWLILVFSLLVILIVLVVNLLSGGNLGYSVFGEQALGLADATQIGTALSTLVFLAIPFGIISYYALQQIFNWTPLSLKWKWTLFAVWVVSLILLIVSLSFVSVQF